MYIHVIMSCLFCQNEKCGGECELGDGYLGKIATKILKLGAATAAATPTPVPTPASDDHMTEEEKRRIAAGHCPYCESCVNDDSHHNYRELMTLHHVARQCKRAEDILQKRAAAATVVSGAAGVGPSKEEKKLDFTLAGSTRGWTEETP